MYIIFWGAGICMPIARLKAKQSCETSPPTQELLPEVPVGVRWCHNAHLNPSGWSRIQGTCLEKQFCFKFANPGSRNLWAGGAQVLWEGFGCTPYPCWGMLEELEKVFSRTCWWLWWLWGGWGLSCALAPIRKLKAPLLLSLGFGHGNGIKLSQGRFRLGICVKRFFT